LATASFSLTVRYAETDGQGIVHHTNYLTWFEEGRSHFLRVGGCPYSRIEQAGFHVVVAEAQVRYRAPARYEDEVLIETRLLQLRGPRLSFAYRALAADGRLLAEGETRHAVLDCDLRPATLPESIVALIAPLQEETDG
jgi:acyl-CoA thioester hydrolase